VLRAGSVHRVPSARSVPLTARSGRRNSNRIRRSLPASRARRAAMARSAAAVSAAVAGGEARVDRAGAGARRPPAAASS
jgi:hypothetical protein